MVEGGAGAFSVMGVLGDGRLRVRLLLGAILFVDQICKEFVAFLKNTESIKLILMKRFVKFVCQCIE
jgi:hypothetical protein